MYIGSLYGIERCEIRMEPMAQNTLRLVEKDGMDKSKALEAALKIGRASCRERV